jgi:hypothetical protein
VALLPKEARRGETFEVRVGAVVEVEVRMDE